MNWTQKYREIGKNRVLGKNNYSKMFYVSPIGIPALSLKKGWWLQFGLKQITGWKDRWRKLIPENLGDCPTSGADQLPKGSSVWCFKTSEENKVGSFHHFKHDWHKNVVWQSAPKWWWDTLCLHWSFYLYGDISGNWNVVICAAGTASKRSNWLQMF